MKFSRLRCLALGLSILLIGAYALAVSPAGDYHLLKKIPFGAAPGGSEYFDYINFDAAARRVYLSHGTEFIVVDADCAAGAKDARVWDQTDPDPVIQRLAGVADFLREL